jgi:hypothetical protein
MSYVDEYVLEAIEDMREEIREKYNKLLNLMWKVESQGDTTLARRIRLLSDLLEDIKAFIERKEEHWMIQLRLRSGCTRKSRVVCRELQGS